MEIELKYSINQDTTADKIWNDEYLKSIEEKDTRHTHEMRALYFDTEDYSLMNNDIALRLRKEGSRIVAALKWDGEADGALHTREELSVPICDESLFENPTPDIFKESDIGKELVEIVAGRKLEIIMSVEVTRRFFRADTDKSLMEISLDTGEIITEKGTTPIRELEIELFSGEQDELLELGQRLKEKYDLTSENNSKYARGLKLLGRI